MVTVAGATVAMPVAELDSATCVPPTGAAMPSVLAEVSFLTNKAEAKLLKTATYRQQIAEALLDAVLRYQQSLKKMKQSTAQVGAR